ncbi:MAG: hypothetical protein ABI894_05970 [Ilumatobacteraceae bacterium]
MRVLHRRMARASTLAALLCVSVASVLIVAPATAVHAAPPGASAYFPVAPNRILDTRVGQGFPQRVTAGATFTLALPGVPAGSSAVVLNLTIDAPAAPGFVTVYPTGTGRPLASSINVDLPGQPIANLVTVPISASGTVDIFSVMATDLVADVEGYYRPTAIATSGRFVPVTPFRLLDTREPTSAHFGALTTGQQIDLNVAGIAGLPADASAAALKVTVTDSLASGFWTVFPAGTTRPTASNLNVVGFGTTIANQVISPLGGGGITVFAQNGGHLVVDLVGWFTGNTALPSDAGLFVAVSPKRLLDSREPPLGLKPGKNRTAQVTVANMAGLPANGIGAVVVNATVTDTTASGYFSLWPAQTYRPTASSLNVTRIGQTIANHVITPVSSGGFAFFTQNGAHLIVDISGWYTGSEVLAVFPPHIPLTGPSGPPPNPTFSTTTTATGATVRWNPCTPIRYTVNMGGYDTSFRPLINEAVERLEAATGLPLVPIGDSTFMPRSSARTSSAPTDGEVVIALSDEVQTDLVPGSVVGQAGYSYNPINGAISQAFVVIDMGDVGTRPQWSSTGPGPVLLHELGHFVGLSHVADLLQMMNAVASSGGPTTYGAGDLTGLWQVGASRGCIT